MADGVEPLRPVVLTKRRRMKKTRDYLWMVIFVAGVLVGVQVPAFVDQYGQALVSHHREAQANLGEFRDDAERYFAGNLDELVAYYRQSDDEVFTEGGRSIEAIAARAAMLEAAVERFHANAFSPYIQTLFNPVTDIRREALESYNFTLVLNSSAILAGLLAGVLAALFFDGCCGAAKYPVSRLRKRKARLARQSPD